MASHYKQYFESTLVDLSPEMLAISRARNPDCAPGEGDMRTVRTYMLTHRDPVPGMYVPSQRWWTFVRNHAGALISSGMSADRPRRPGPISMDQAVPAGMVGPRRRT
jgi:hypothetical protein